MQFTVSRETHDKLRRAQDLLRHSIPTGDAAAIFNRALTILLADLERAKLAAAVQPRSARSAASGSRHVPAAVKREVWKRDGGQCAFVGTEGRCTERGFIEFHHVRPYADGGATVVENLELRCRAHNVYEAEQILAVSCRCSCARPVAPITVGDSVRTENMKNESTSHVSTKSQLAALHSRISYSRSGDQENLSQAQSPPDLLNVSVLLWKS